MKVSMKALVELIICNGPQSIVHAYIQPTYIDFGANWIANTIIIDYFKDGRGGSYQALSPRDLRMLDDGTFTYEDAQKFIAELNKRGW